MCVVCKHLNPGSEGPARRRARGVTELPREKGLFYAPVDGIYAHLKSRNAVPCVRSS